MHQRCHRHEMELASSESREIMGPVVTKGSVPVQSVKSVVTEISCARGETHALGSGLNFWNNYPFMPKPTVAVETCLATRIWLEILFNHFARQIRWLDTPLFLVDYDCCDCNLFRARIAVSDKPFRSAFGIQPCQ